MPLLLGVGLLAIGVLAGPTAIGIGWGPDQTPDDRDRITLASVPSDTPELGLVYSGLEAAPRDSACAGAYEMGDPQTCTHGPDTAPTGFKVGRDVAPVTGPAAKPRTPSRETGQPPSDAEIIRDEGGTALADDEPALVPDAAPGAADFILGNHDVACDGDGHTGKRVQVLYLHESGTASRYADYLGSIRSWAAGVDSIVDASAAETGGSRHVRFVTTPQCRVDVAEVQLPEGALSSFRTNMAALQQLGYNRADRKYLLFADTNVYCGIATFIADRRPGAGNRNNGGPAYGRIDAGCWGTVVATRELVRSLGALLEDSPNADADGQCTDGNDIFCSTDATTVRAVCADKKHLQRLDCNHDDYFNTNPSDGTYLAQHWNVARSEFLLRGDGGDEGDEGRGEPADGQDRDGADVPGGPTSPPATTPPATEPTTPPATTAPPSTPTTTPPSPSTPATSGDAPPAAPEADGESDLDLDRVAAPLAATSAPSEQAAEPARAVLEIRDSTSTSARLTWSEAQEGATYEVAVDGVPIATTTATRARLIGLRPDATYEVTIADPRHRYLARAEAQTAPAARPAADSWFVLTNSLTGGAADLYAARSATGTPIVLNGAEGGAQQQFKLLPRADGAVSLQSRATGKCLTPAGDEPAAGEPLVQAECAADDSAQRFTVKDTDHGFSLRSTVGDVVVGVGSQRFGAHRLLVLQDADGSRHQSWTALPG